MSEEQTTRRCNFFVSYTGVDTTWAEWIAWQLKEAGYEVTIQAWHFRPGMNRVALVRQALDTCQRTIAVVSQAYLEQSPYGSDEWTAAFTHDDPTSSSLLLVLIEPVNLPRLLRPLIHISLADLAPDQATVQLLDGVRPGPAEPTVAPAFPGRAGPDAGGGPRYPGHYPEIANLEARNPAFAGRDDLLDQLRQRLHQQGSAVAVVPAQALHGLGGVGKTQLALEYAHRYQADYDLIWWIKAETPGAIPAGLAALAPRLGLVDDPTQVADQEQLAAAVLDALRQRSRWLLVFDNVPDRQQLLAYVPQGDGQVLITSRSPVWGGTAQPVKVDTFSRAESVAFLTHRTSTQDDTTADALAEELGDLSLALEQAAAFMEQIPMPLPEYLGLFRRRREELLGRGDPTAYKGTVDTTWQLAVEQVATIAPGGPSGVALLRLCAFLAPEAIPLDLLSERANLLPEELAAAARDELALGYAVAALYRYSLVDRDQAGLRVHRLVQEVVRYHLTQQERDAWAALAIRLLGEAFPTQLHEPANWPRCAQLIPHVLAAADYTTSQPAAGAVAGILVLLDWATEYLWLRAELHAAQAAATRALTIKEAAFGSEHPKVASTLTTLGNVLQRLGELAAARAAHERALTIKEAAFGSEHPEVASILSNLGNVLRELGELPAARAALERALTIFEAAYGPDHPEVASPLGNLGIVLAELGELAAARAALERVLAIEEAAYGPNHPDVARTLTTLGNVLRELGELAAARAAHERALTITEAAYGPDHPQAAITRTDLGNVLQELGELADLGIVLAELGELAAARAALERALTIFEEAYGPNHPELARILTNLSIVLEQLGELAAAQAAQERALTILLEAAGPADS